MEEDSQPEKNITIQEPLFNLEIVDYKPAMGTAHLRHTVMASDGLEYAIKGVSDGDASALTGIPTQSKFQHQSGYAPNLLNLAGSRLRPVGF